MEFFEKHRSSSFIDYVIISIILPKKVCSENNIKVPLVLAGSDVKPPPGLFKRCLEVIKAARNGAVNICDTRLICNNYHFLIMVNEYTLPFW